MERGNNQFLSYNSSVISINQSINQSPRYFYSKVVLHSLAPSDVDNLNLGQTSIIKNPERDELKAN
jgi:hypothetical protein